MDQLAALAEWENFLSAQVGAAATLAGLLFVGVSLNLSKILAAEFLPLRALLALLVFFAVLVIASLLLMPNQSRTASGIDVLIVATPTWIFGSWVEVRGWRRRNASQNPVTLVSNAILFEIAALALVVSGVLILLDAQAALHLLGVGVVLSYAKAVADAWVLLVEINR